MAVCVKSYAYNIVATISHNAFVIAEAKKTSAIVVLLLSGNYLAVCVYFFVNT